MRVCSRTKASKCARKKSDKKETSREIRNVGSSVELQSRRREGGEQHGAPFSSVLSQEEILLCVLGARRKREEEKIRQ